MRSITRAGTRGRRSLAALAGLLLVAISAAPALACGGLIGPNGAVNLLRTTTLAGYHDGVEHYITSFEFAGGGGSFGSLTPLPGVPTSVEKGITLCARHHRAAHDSRYAARQGPDGRLRFTRMQT